MSSTSLDSILVAVRDPSQRRQIAIGKAAGMAARSGARITLFHAFSMPSPLPDPMPATADAVLSMVAKERRQQLLKLARPLRTKAIRVQCVVAWDFPPAHAIVRHVLALKPDLVVAESHRHSRLARWFLANSDWELIRECPCPVWFVKQERVAKHPRIVTAVDPTHAHAKPSGLDDRLLEVAAMVSQQLDGRIALVHVVDTTQSLPNKLMARTVKSGTVAGSTTDALDRLAKRYEIPAADRLVRPGNPTEVLIASADELDADLLVMGAVSRSGLSHFHIGNTAEAVIDSATCDVLVIKPRQFKTSVARKRPTLAATGERHPKRRASKSK